MQVTHVKVYPTTQGILRAYADITIDNSLCLRKLRLLRNPNGYMLCMPNGQTEESPAQELEAGDEYGSLPNAFVPGMHGISAFCCASLDAMHGCEPHCLKLDGRINDCCIWAGRVNREGESYASNV
jgi:hypothetical protein